MTERHRYFPGELLPGDIPYEPPGQSNAKGMRQDGGFPKSTLNLTPWAVYRWFKMGTMI